MLLALAHVLLGWFAADLFTALVHLVMDRLFGTRAERIPWLGTLIRDFELHHRRPAYFLQGGFWYSNRENLATGALIGALAFLMPWPWLVGSMAVGVAFAQESHRWSHRHLYRSNVPRRVQALQRLRIMLPPAAHHLHHTGFERNYSVLCGWSNPLLNAVLDGAAWLVRRS